MKEFQTLDEIKQYIQDQVGDSTTVVYFDNNMGYAYETAFIGLDKENRAMYDYDKMVEYLVKEFTVSDDDDEDTAYEQAIEWIRALPYVEESVRPVIVYPTEWYEAWLESLSEDEIDELKKKYNFFNFSNLDREMQNRIYIDENEF